MSNAVCFYNDSGILSVREDGSVIAFIYTWKPGVERSGPDVLLNGRSVSNESVKNSLEIFNVDDVGNKKCSWGGVSIATWREGTKQYNCEGGLSFWIEQENLVGFRILPESFAGEVGVDIKINGTSVQSMNSSDFKRMLGGHLNKREYWSEY
jgi:hypothetical protein